jgi:hypothetical protein
MDPIVFSNQVHFNEQILVHPVKHFYSRKFQPSNKQQVHKKMDGCEESTDPDEQASAKNALRKIETAIRAAQKNGRDCFFCSHSFELESKNDIFRLYSAALSCVVHHSLPISPLSYEDLYVVESFVLEEVVEEEAPSFEKIFTCGCENMERDTLLRTSEEYFCEESININCEQEIESLMYKLYRLGGSTPTSKDMELLLLILHKRSETVRFFRVFSGHRKTAGMFKLALLATLKDESCYPREKLLREMRSYRFENSSYFTEEESFLKNEFADLKRIDLREWLDEKRREQEWRDCVHVWATNRADASGAVNKPMIDLCMQYGKYEEGWIVYQKGCEKSKYVLHKACVLALKALKESRDKKWIDRLLSILEDSSVCAEDGSCCLVADDIMRNLADVSEEIRTKILVEFTARVGRIGTNEELLSLIIRGLSRLARKCLNTKTCELCATYANLFYTQWKTCRNPGVISSEYGSEVYSSMLGVCDTLKDRDGFNSICRDLADSEASITKDLCEKIESFNITGMCGFELAPTEKASSRRRLVFRNIKD